MSSPAPRVGATLLGWLAMLAVAATGCDRPRRDAPGSAEIWLAGDVHLGGAPVSPDDVRARLEPLAAWTTGAAGVINLEGPATASAGAEAPPDRLANHPDGLAGLRAAGVEVVGIANNHAYDGGKGAPRLTAGNIGAAGMIPVGLDVGMAVVERGGLRIGE